MEQQAEIERLSTELEQERAEVANLRRLLAQIALRLEAVPRLEADVAAMRLRATADANADATAD